MSSIKWTSIMVYEMVKQSKVPVNKMMAKVSIVDVVLKQENELILLTKQ